MTATAADLVIYRAALSTVDLQAADRALLAFNAVKCSRGPEWTVYELPECTFEAFAGKCGVLLAASATPSAVLRGLALIGVPLDGISVTEVYPVART